MTSAPAHPIGRWRLPDQIDVIEPLTDGHIIEGIVAIAANPGVAGVDAYLEPAAAALLGVGDMVLLVIRADGHVGLRAERRHAETLSAYVALLRASPGAAP